MFLIRKASEIETAIFHVEVEHHQAVARGHADIIHAGFIRDGFTRNIRATTSVIRGGDIIKTSDRWELAVLS